MRAHQIMTRSVITVTPETTIVEAANIMLQKHVSGLPVVDAAGKLVGIVSEGDFIRRSEIGTQRKRGRWLRFILGSGKSASDFVHEHGRKVSEVMTKSPLTITEDTALDEIVELMEKNNVKRLPVIRGDKVVGIVSRANLLQAVASLAREVPDPTADDDHIRNRVIDAMEKNDWCPFGLSVIVQDGIVHLSGVITEERSRQAAVVAAENRRGREEGSRPSVLGRHDVRHVPELAGRRRPRQGELKGLKQLSVRPKERMWPVELADRHLMGHEVAESLARKPGVEVEGRRLDLEGRLAQFCEVEVDGMIGRRADRAGHCPQTSSAQRGEHGRWRSVARADGAG